MNQWTHIGFTYAVKDETKGEARLFINGTFKYRSGGEGFISKDWDGFAAIGSDNSENCFIGYVDEFILFDRALNPEEIATIYEKCHFEKYYTGETIKADHGVILSPGYPKLHMDPISAHWVLKSQERKFIDIFIEELKIGRNESCERSNLILRDLISGFLIDRICGGVYENKSIQTNSSSIVIDFESSGETDGIKYKIKFSRSFLFVIIGPIDLKKRDKIIQDSCFKNSKIIKDLENVESEELLVNGVYSSEEDCTAA